MTQDEIDYIRIKLIEAGLPGDFCLNHSFDLGICPNSAFGQLSNEFAIKVDFQNEPSSEQHEAVASFATALDLSSTAVQHALQVKKRDEAIALLNGNDPHAVRLRAILKVVFKSIAVLYQKLGLPIRTFDELVAAAAEEIANGSGDVS